MIISRYSNKAKENLGYLREINEAIKDSCWKKKFAFTMTQVTVPGHDSIQVSNFALFRYYYIRTVYEISDVYSHKISLRKKLIKCIPSKDAISYFSVHNDLAHRDRTREVPKVDLSQYMLATDKPLMAIGYLEKDKVKKARRIYRNLYEPLAGTKLTKGLMTPDDFDKLEIVCE